MEFDITESNLQHFVVVSSFFSLSFPRVSRRLYREDSYSKSKYL